MKKKKEFEVWANKELKNIQKALLLEHFLLNPIEYKESKGSLAQSVTHYPYKEMTFSYSESLYKLWEEGDKKSALATLIHEVCHPLTDGLYCKGTNRYSTMDEIADERESLTDHIANILIKHKIL